MMVLSLTQIARKTLENSFKGKSFVLDKQTREKYKNKRACFVTLTEQENLRGCIGSLEATQELWKDVQENALRAAFEDYRFPPLTKEELKKIKIEVSVLTEAKKLDFKNSDELLKKINNSMGIILKKGVYTATFLPQVWKQIPNKKRFLEELSLKAGLSKDSWKNPSTEFFYYKVKAYSG